MALNGSYEYNFSDWAEKNDHNCNFTSHKDLYAYETCDNTTKTIKVNNYYDETVSSTKKSSKPLTSPLFDKKERDWNEEFQQILDQFLRQTNEDSDKFDLQFYEQTLVERQEIASKLRELCANFGTEATTAAQTIIQENDVPVWNKTILPRELVVIHQLLLIIFKGGIAGGSKYVWKNMVLKFAIDNGSAIYGGNDELIMKVANQELKGLQTLIECKIEGLHFPLMALVDYHGYRVIASSLLPIDRTTLVYGSPDGGVSVCDHNTEAKQKIAQAALILNLKPHYFNNVEFYGPVDMEVHLGKDGRFYVIDTSRLFPPTLPVANNLMKRSGQLLAYHFRPVVVKKYKQPLSSDALSGFGKDAREKHDPEVVEATKTLINELIPQFAKQLSADVTIRKYSEHVLSTISSKFHVYGINLRYLGVVRRHVTTRIMRDQLLLLMIARTAKSMLQQEWRASRNLVGTETATVSQDMKQVAPGTSRPCGRSGERTVLDPEKQFKKAVAGMLSNIIAKTDGEVEAWRARLSNRVSLSTSAESYQEKGKLFWTKFIQEEIGLKYVDGLTEEEKNLDLRTLFHFTESDSSWRLALSLYFSKLVGLNQAFPNQLFVKGSLINKLDPRTKLLDIAYKDLGIAQVAHAEQLYGSGKCAALVLQAAKTLELAYKIKSDDSQINLAIALNTVLLGKLGFIDPAKIAHAENLCEDCIKQSTSAKAQLLKAQLQFQRAISAKIRGKKVSMVSLLEPLLKQLQSDNQHNSNWHSVLLENQAKIFFAQALLQGISSTNLHTNLDLLTRINSMLHSIDQQILLPHNLVLFRSQTLLFLHQYYASQKGTILTKSQETILEHWEQTYREVIHLLRSYCTEHTRQCYDLLEQWDSALRMVDSLDSVLGDFVKAEIAVFDDCTHSLRKQLWPENDIISIAITNTASGEMKQRNVEICVHNLLQGDTIPFLKKLTFRLHPTAYPNTLSLMFPPFVLTTTSYGVSTGMVELEFCQSILHGKEAGWNVSLEWQISPEKDFSKTIFELNLTDQTVIIKGMTLNQ